MKKFVENIPGQIAFVFTIMLINFTAISLVLGIENVPTTRLLEFFVLAIIGGVLMEFAFGKCIIKNMPVVKRICIFIVPFGLVTFLCAVIFQWITRLDKIETYIWFIGIFMVCGVLSVIIAEIEHRIRGKQYTKKLKEYQEKSFSE